MCLQFVRLYALLFMGFLVIELLFNFVSYVIVSDFNLMSYALDEGKKLGVRK